MAAPALAILCFAPLSIVMAPNSSECNQIKSTRLHPDNRERRNKSAAPTATPEAPGKPRRPKHYLVPGRHRQSRRHTNDTTTPTIHHAPHRGALCGRAMHCLTTTRPFSQLRDHRRCSCGTRNGACARHVCGNTHVLQFATPRTGLASAKKMN